MFGSSGLCERGVGIGKLLWRSLLLLAILSACDFAPEVQTWGVEEILDMSGKTVILIRHAKSSWKDRDLRDMERLLNKRGQRDAPMMGQRLAARWGSIDALVSSPARRALDTAEAIADELDVSRGDIVVDDRVYHASSGELLDVIVGFDEGWDRVALVGHNPGIHELAEGLTDLDVRKFPTCAIAEIHFDVEAWSHVKKVEAELLDYDYPKSGR